MKEKTFEELTRPYRFYGANSLEELIIEENVLKLLQQVREATIAECIDKVSELHGSIYKGAYEEYLATNLPTDRIKIEPVQ